jgi:hypothetical protein
MRPQVIHELSIERPGRAHRFALLDIELQVAES